MRKIIIAAALTMSLTGCAGSLPPVDDNIGRIIQQVQAITSAACAFLPTATTIANIFVQDNPVLMTAESIASAICQSLVPRPAAARRVGKAWVPTVAGVPIKGRRL